MTGDRRPPAKGARRRSAGRERRAGRTTRTAATSSSGRRYRPAHRAPRRGLNRLGRTRAFTMLVVTAVAFATIGVKLVTIQGFDSASYLAAGGGEWEQTVTLPGQRGAILDRNGYELAMSVPQTTIYADPRQVADPPSEAAALSKVLGAPVARLQAQLSEHKSFVYMARTIPDAEAAAVAALGLPGVYSLSESKRFYPAGNLASPLLGLVGTDGTGLSGLEYEYNSVLTGHNGKKTQEVDPSGRLVPGGVQSFVAPTPGADVVLTIDQALQYQAEQALAQALVAAKAHKGIVMLMDTGTGDILADAELMMPGPGTSTTPAVPVHVGNLATGQAQPVESPSASSFTDVYEPGSVNKLVTISAALQQGIIVPSDVFTIPDSYAVADGIFHDAESHPLEHWTVTDVLANSSNIGTIQIAQKLGRSALMHFIGSYGLGAATSIGFPGESAGLLPTYWSGTSIADVPIGQGIAVTAVQMLAAYNTVANGGVYVPPRLIHGTIDASGREHVIPLAAGHRVIDATVANEMTTMLDEVVRVGTGTAAGLDPYTVAGKTGTALVPSPTGGYEAGHYVASFGGFVPAEKPQITAMVVIDDTPDYGAAASAPTFGVIARDALQKFSIPPMPKQPPAPGVPLATVASATGAGDVAGTPLPGLVAQPATAPAPPATTATPVSPATPLSTAPRTPGGGSGGTGRRTTPPTTATTTPPKREPPTTTAGRTGTG